MAATIRGRRRAANYLGGNAYCLAPFVFDAVVLGRGRQDLQASETEKGALYRSVQHDDEQSHDVPKNVQSKTFGSPHMDCSSELYGPGALRHRDYPAPYTSS